MADEKATRTLLPKQSNVVDYVRERLDTFDERPLGAVDSLVFSWLAYTRLPHALGSACFGTGIGLHELLRAEDFEQMFGSTWDPQGSRDLLIAVCASPRFREVRLAHFRFKTDPDHEEQFAAMTFLLPQGGAYVAFCGTDSTVVGWKEDFNMTFQNPVPAQAEAVAYLDEVARETAGPLYVGGHSKGGNLAVYAAAMCGAACRSRIERAWSHDGPGFHRSFVRSEAYRSLEGRLEKTVPKSTVVGAMLSEGPACEISVVESDGISLLQHSPFLWAVDVEGARFVAADGPTASSRYLSSTLNTWMDQHSFEERQRFVDALFGVVAVTGATRFADIMADRKTSLPLMLQAVDALDADEQQFVKDVLKSFAKTATVGKALDRKRPQALPVSEG